MGDISLEISPPDESSAGMMEVEALDGNNDDKLTLLTEAKCFGGNQLIFKHASKETSGGMKFAVFIPEMTSPEDKFHTVILLAGIMCNEQNFYLRTGFQRFASEQKLIVVCPDTSPRECRVPGDRDVIFVGRSAGWYLDATQEPWKTNYRMYSYISQELPRIINQYFPTTGKIGLCGHSMGGHGTVVIGLRNPETFQSLSLLAPSCNAITWGKEIIFDVFLGENNDEVTLYDPRNVVQSYNGPLREILIDQGLEDEYLENLAPQKLVDSAADNPNSERCLKINLRMQEGYDHSYYFVASFIEEHLKHHAKILNSL